MKKLVIFGLSLLALLSLNSIYAATAIGTTNITFADTIVAKIVSEIYNYPVVIIPRNTITQDILQELNELNTTEIIIIGGPYVITPNVEEELKNLGYNVTRIWGVTRYETSALVAKYFWDESDKAIIVTRELTEENLKAIEVPILKEAIDKAIELKAPLLITPIGNLDESVADALVDLGVKHVYIFTKAPKLNTNLTRELKELNITYEIITTTRPYVPTFCKNITTIEIPPGTPWYKIKELLIKSCIRIKLVNKTVNLTEIRKKLRKMLLLKYKKVIRNQTRLRYILEKRIEKLFEEIEKNCELLEKYGDPTAKKLALRIRNELNNTIQLMNQGEIQKAMVKLIEMHRELLMLKWQTKLYKLEEKVKRIEEIIKRLRKRRIKILARIYNLTEEEIEKEIRNSLPDLWEIKKKIFKKLKKRRRIFCIQIYEPVICNGRQYPNLCYAIMAGEDPKTCKRVIIARGPLNVGMRHR